ncbi:histidine phosphatase family protein [Breoghania sp.]|uniref:SixA phosphatase family protein n=1 Tax=Breoghania sp. TaxID=2065378 RepID=UPI00260586D1|nr:histidine phosphatase family protein [Breoghania sp.]MDJ0932119.1 histidine phosphatase family protein [Breoghania sp.]
MPRLMLLRHAKSSWAEMTTSDFERPLASRGQRNAPLMGRYMETNALLPDRVLCSSALRARLTFSGLLPFFDIDFDTLFLRDIYDTLDDDYMPLIRHHGGNAQSLMLIDHNPAAIHETALALVQNGTPEDIKRLEEGFPTATLAVIDFDCEDWDSLEPQSGRLVALIKPRDLEVMVVS